MKRIVFITLLAAIVPVTLFAQKKISIKIFDAKKYLTSTFVFERCRSCKF